MLIQPQLANTFRRLAAGGADEWYRGEIAKEIADRKKALDDLKRQVDSLLGKENKQAEQCERIIGGVGGSERMTW